MSIAALIERLEKATGPDREIDGRIWAELDERDVRVAYVGYWGKDGLLAKSRRQPRDECVVGVFMDGELYTVGQSNPPAEYTKSIDAALTLVPENHRTTICTEEITFDGEILQSEVLVVPFGEYYRWVDRACQGPTPAIALCIAALKARLDSK